MLYTTSGPSPYWVIEIIKTESVKSKIHHNGNKATKKFFCIRIISENLMHRQHNTYRTGAGRRSVATGS